MNANLEVNVADVLEIFVAVVAFQLSTVFPWLRWHQAHAIAQTAFVLWLLRAL
jgi:hypothetical protein